MTEHEKKKIPVKKPKTTQSEIITVFQEAELANQKFYKDEMKEQRESERIENEKDRDMLKDFMKMMFQQKK